MGMLQPLFRKRLAGLVPEERGGADLELIKAQLREIVGYHLTKESIINTFRRVVEFDMNFTFTPQDLQEWPGSVLLIMSDDDPGTPEPVREAMKALYPQAKLRILSGTGHAAPLIKRDEYLSAIETFLA
jgi:pimeloyl-ACP methyl ester carboxylesterase